MDASFRRHIDDQPRPPMEVRRQRLSIICLHAGLWIAAALPFNHAWKNQSGHLSGGKSVLYSAITKNVCRDRRGDRVLQSRTFIILPLSYLRDRQHVAVDNLSDFLVIRNKMRVRILLASQKQCLS